MTEHHATMKEIVSKLREDAAEADRDRGAALSDAQQISPKGAQVSEYALAAGPAGKGPSSKVSPAIVPKPSATRSAVTATSKNFRPNSS